VQLHIVLLQTNLAFMDRKSGAKSEGPYGELKASRDKRVEPGQLLASTARDVGVVDIDVDVGQSLFVMLVMA
jgi:hypothetical protein